MRVWTDIGLKKPKPLLARIISTKSKMYTIQYLSPTEDRLKGRTIYRYEDETYEVDDDSIYEYLSLSNENDMGFVEIEGGYIKDDSDEEYVPSDAEEEDDEESEDNIDSDEELEDEDEDDYSEDDDEENY